jgi:hypothetical protein
MFRVSLLCGVNGSTDPLTFVNQREKSTWLETTAFLGVIAAAWLFGFLSAKVARKYLLRLQSKIEVR